MDDLELEARLRAHLHRRFDDPPIPAGLTPNVSQVLAAATRPVGLATGTGRLRVGWAGVAAVVVVAIAAIGIGSGVGSAGRGGVSTPTPSTVPVTQHRLFIVLPGNGTLVGASESSLAVSVLSARLQALGVGNFTAAGDNVLHFSIPVGGPSDETIRALLAATGDVRVVPLPAADYGAGMRVPTLGAPLPKDEPALFGWEGITTVTIGIDRQSLPDLTLTLKAAAARAFGDYTTAHVGETFAIVVDGRVALLPIVQAAITDGQVAISLAPVSGPTGLADTEAETAAILVGGELPEAWRGASIPVLISRDAAITSALAVRRGTIQDASQGVQLSTSISGDAWQVVWNVEVVVPDCPANASCPWAAGTYLVRVDGVTGSVIHVGVLE